MVTDRKGALRRFNGLSIRVEQHLEKIVGNPASDEVPHWTAEIRQWIIQMEHVLPRAGQKTAAIWKTRIAPWKGRLGDG
jgi:hypothetical protein